MEGTPTSSRIPDAIASAPLGAPIGAAMDLTERAETAIAEVCCPRCGAPIVETDEPTLCARCGVGKGRSRWGVLRHPYFRNIWVAGFTTNVGGWMEHVGMGWVMADLTTRDAWVDAKLPGATLMLGYLSVCQCLPTVFFGIPGGVVADRVNRKRLLLVTQFLLMLIAAFLAVAAWRDWLTPWLLLGVGGAMGTAMAFNMPAWQTLTPRLVPREELTQAIFMQGIQFNMARVVGPALGGLLMKLFGPTVLFALNTVSFTGVLAAVAATPDVPAPARDGRNAWQLTREAAAFCWRDKASFRLILGMVLFSALATPMIRFLPLLVRDIYHAQEGTYGTLLACMGGGAVIGGMGLKLVPRWYPKHHFIPMSILTGGAAVVGLAVAPTALAAMIAIFLCGVTWLWVFNSSTAALQLLVDDRMRGRVLAISNTLIFGAMPAGAVAVGWIAHAVSGRDDDGLGTQVGLGALAIVLVASGLVMLIWRTPEIDGLKAGEKGFDRRPGLWGGITAAAHRPMR